LKIGRDGITGLVVLAASLFLFWATLGLERHPMVPVGPGFYPRIVLGITAALAFCLVLVDFIAHRAGRAPAGGAGATGYGQVVVAFAIFGAYVVALPYLGFRLATLAFLLVMQFALERPANARSWIVLVIVAGVATVACYYVFEAYLKVLLPRGRWTDF
jgi:putative tricarboxylic transport membrane protein